MTFDEKIRDVYTQMHLKEFGEPPRGVNADLFCKMVCEYEKEVSHPHAIRVDPAQKAIFVMKLCQDAFAVLHKEKVFVKGKDAKYVREAFANQCL